MTPNDAQIDLLLRRYSRNTGESAQSARMPGVEGSVAPHLDADELNAFAEGALPARSRAKYVSHLADCDQCRKLATQLAVAAGRAVEARAETAETICGRISFWQNFRNLFAGRNLRYAAFALVVIAAAGITFIALRRGLESRPESALVAGNTETAPAPGSAIKPADEGARPGDQFSQNPQRGASPSTSQNSNTSQGPAVTKQPSTLSGNASTVEPRKEMTLEKNALSEQKKAENTIAEAAPSYAPPPPGERNESVSNEEQRSKDLRAAAPKPSTSSSPGNFKIMERGGLADEAARNRELEADRARSGQAGTNQNEAPANRPRGPANTGSSSVARRAERNKTADTQVQNRDQDAALSAGGVIETRKAGGHNFRRQGSAWIDTKFKSSMPVITVSRGSDEFRALDSAIRSIAGQLSGEVVVVHKGKAYRIR